MWCLTHWFWLSYILPWAARNPMMEFLVSIALSSPVTFVKWHEKGRQTPLLILAYLSLGTDIAFPKETWPVLKEAVLGSGLTTQQYCGWSKKWGFIPTQISFWWLMQVSVQAHRKVSSVDFPSHSISYKRGRHGTLRRYVFLSQQSER